MNTQVTSDIILDGNIFGLQVHGGISSYVARLYVEFFRINKKAGLILPRNVTYQGFGASEIAAAHPICRERLPARFMQYLPAAITNKNVVFHSAYYRRPAKNVARYVVTVHDFTYERYRKGGALWMHHRVKSAAILAADAVICISEATRQDTLEFCPSVDPTRLHVVHHGVDVQLFRPDQNGAPDAMDHTILFVGQREGYKRFDLAVTALALLEDFRLGFVGPPPTPAEILLLDRYIPGRWTWFGRVDNAALRALYSSAYAFIFSSDYEGFGLPVLEAMACGCPVVTSSDAALREIGGTSALFASEQQPEAYAAALNLLSSVGKRADMIARGSETAAQFNWQDCARRTLAIQSGASENGGDKSVAGL